MRIKQSIINYLAVCLFTAAAIIPLQAATIGYTDGTCTNSTTFRLGSSTTQGMAMRLGGDKLKALRGQTISAVEAVFGSRNSTDNKARLFIATSPDGTPLCEQEVKISRSLKWLTFELDRPYTITGEEEALYIGYTIEIGDNYRPLSADRSADMRDACYAYKDGVWTDLYGTGFGCVNIRAIVSGGLTLTDLTLKPFALEGYYKEGTPYSYSGQLFNFGTETVNSFDITISAGNGEPQTFRYENQNLASGGTFNFSLPEYTATEMGKMAMRIEVNNVNGTGDDEPGDNVQTPDVFFYPANMERCILLEGFTGQDCSNCPEGHRYITSALAATDMPVAEVMHHSGFYPDFFTMDADIDYTFFFNGSNYAPAVMLNRTVNPAIGSVPVMNTSIANIGNTLEMLADRQPYVSLKLNTEYDAASREAKIKFTAYVYNDLPGKQNLFNIGHAQGCIKAYQENGGTEYEHSMVFRGVLTGNSWGIALPEEKCVAGSTFEWETTYTLPEAIFSDYWTDDLLASAGYPRDLVTHATDPDDMYITAYIGAYDLTDVEKNEIYNCVQVKLGESYEQGVTAISAARQAGTAAEPAISADGNRISVSGADSYAVYNAAGRQVPAGASLGSGLYIVRATADGLTTVKKILIK